MDSLELSNRRVGRAQDSRARCTQGRVGQIFNLPALPSFIGKAQASPPRPSIA